MYVCWTQSFSDECKVGGIHLFTIYTNKYVECIHVERLESFTDDHAFTLTNLFVDPWPWHLPPSIFYTSIHFIPESWRIYVYTSISVCWGCLCYFSCRNGKKRDHRASRILMLTVHYRSFSSSSSSIFSTMRRCKNANIYVYYVYIGALQIAFL